MLTPWEFDRLREQRALALKAAQHPTPGHAAAAAASEYADDNAEIAEVMRRRRRVQHEADPCPLEADGAVEPDMDKRYAQAYDTPSGYPAMGPPVNPEAFRRWPLTAGEAAYSPGYAPSARPVPVPSAALSAAAVSRPLITDGQSRPSAEGC